MTEIATMTSKSMVTIPTSIRRKSGISEGTKVQFVEVDGTIMMVPLKSLSETYGMFKEHAKEIIQGIRELQREHRQEARRWTRAWLSMQVSCLCILLRIRE